MAKQNNDLATKQFVKDIVKEAEDRLSKRIDKLGVRVNSLEDKLDKLDTKVNKLNTKVNKLDTKLNQVLNKLDGLAKLINNYQDKSIIQKYRQEQLENKVDKNTKRITKLEQQSANA